MKYAPDPTTWSRPISILRAFRHGADTREIASYLWLPEATVLAELNAAREAERATIDGAVRNAPLQIGRGA